MYKLHQKQEENCIGHSRGDQLDRGRSSPSSALKLLERSDLRSPYDERKQALRSYRADAINRML